ncbi:MAG: DUF362 domain-containing protein [Candidatus Omnitrophota bacterium]
MPAKVSLLKCASYDPQAVFDAVKKAVGLLGGISAFIKPKSKVLVKPNLLMAKGPESGIVTHPEVVRAVVRLLKENECRIYLGDGPCASVEGAGKVQDAYLNSGMAAVAGEEGVELVYFNKRRWRGKFPLTTWLDDCDYLVSVPKFKTHGMTLLTGAIKNSYGLVSGSYKAELHKRYYRLLDFAKIVTDIYAEVRPSLTVIDGIVAMEGDGPATSGSLRNTGILLAGSDCVALDSVLAKIMGIEPEDVFTTREAARRGLGTSDIQAIEVCGERLEDVRGEPFKLPATSLTYKLPAPIVAFAWGLLKLYPQLIPENCLRCGDCVIACPNKVISMGDRGIVIDYRGCISCFCCQESCPASAIRVKKSILAKVMGL